MTSRPETSVDLETAQAFANSWNSLPTGSVYTQSQFEEWMLPLKAEDFSGKKIIELGCGNGSLMVHLLRWNPDYLEGVDLGDSVKAARESLEKADSAVNWKVAQGDILTYTASNFDIAYCIGVLHHLKNPEEGFRAVLRSLKPGGRFHCWVYAREGNAIVRLLVEPLRRLSSKMPWWFTKYIAALPLAGILFCYAGFISLLDKLKVKLPLPLREYCLWISKTGFNFHWHVVRDQLVSPQTDYITKERIESWFAESSGQIDKQSLYIILRNGNSWKFGGRLRSPL